MVTINITPEQQDEITKETLKECIHSIMTLKDTVVGDPYDLTMVNHMLHTVSYFMTGEEFDKYLQENNTIDYFKVS